jgi:hypothetical protein
VVTIAGRGTFARVPEPEGKQPVFLIACGKERRLAKSHLGWPCPLAANSKAARVPNEYLTWPLGRRPLDRRADWLDVRRFVRIVRRYRTVEIGPAPSEHRRGPPY